MRDGSSHPSVMGVCRDQLLGAIQVRVKLKRGTADSELLEGLAWGLAPPPMLGESPLEDHQACLGGESLGRLRREPSQL